MGENLSHLYIWQGINNQNIGDSKNKVPKSPWCNETIGKWTEQSFFFFLFLRDFNEIQENTNKQFNEIGR
jgi:hypothetical protein